MSEPTNHGVEDEVQHGYQRRPFDRWRLANVLIGLTTVFGVLAVFTVGIRYQALDTDEWVDLSSELLDDAEVQEALANHLVDTVYAELDVRAGFDELLPESLQRLGGSVAGALRGPLADGVVTLIDSDRFQRSWATANRAAHENLVKVLRDDTEGAVSFSGGLVTLDLRPLVLEVGQTLGLPQRTLDRLPDDAGSLVILESEQLDSAQRFVRLVDFLNWFVVALVITLYSLAVYLAKGRRIVTMRRVGWSVLAVGILVLVTQSLARRAVVDRLVDRPSTQGAVDAALGLGTALLRRMGWSLAMYGVLIIFFAALLGAHSWATALRQRLAPTFHTSPAAVVGSAAIVTLLLITWRPGRAFEDWPTALLLATLLIGGVLTLLLRSRREFAPPTPSIHAP